MLSTGFFFSAAAAPEGFVAAAPEGAAFLPCAFMNHFRMSDDYAPQKAKQEPLSRRQRPRTGNESRSHSPNKSPRREEYQPGRAREKERGQERTHHLRRGKGRIFRARETEKLEVFPGFLARLD